MHSIASLRFLLAASQVLASNGFWLYLDEHGIINTAQKLRPFPRSSNAHHLHWYQRKCGTDISTTHSIRSCLKQRKIARVSFHPECPNTISSVDSENIVTNSTLGNRFHLRINPPMAINNEFYLVYPRIKPQHC